MSVVDDGSTDGTPQLLQRMVKSDNRLQLVRQPQRGASAARNAGFRLSTGRYIQFLDSDDILDPQKVATQVGALESDPQFDFSYCTVRDFADRTGSLGDVQLRSDMFHDDIAGAFLTELPFSMPAVIYRRATCLAVAPWNEHLRFFEDYKYHFRVALAARSWEFTN